MNSNKTKLSKSILEMKFMKRTKEKVEKQQFQEEGEEYFGNQLTQSMKGKSGRFIIEPSYVFCEKLIDGRVSYRGMNPEIEKLMELEQSDKKVKENLKKETDISDEQMVNRFGPRRKKFKCGTDFPQLTKSEDVKTEDGPVRKKPKFLKPQD